MRQKMVSHNGVLEAFLILIISSICKGRVNFQCPPSISFRDVYTKISVCNRINKATCLCEEALLNKLNVNSTKEKPIVIIISDMCDKTNPKDNLLVKAYSNRGTDIVIYVEHLLSNWKAPCPFAYTEIIAHSLVTFVLRLYDINKSATPQRTHILGIGIGAVIAGYASMIIPSAMFNRITGLDPTLFYTDSPNASHIYPLKPRVAEFTDVYHTNTGMIGRNDLLGDVDIYFNNGIHMPGCENINLCSHKKAVEYFADTIYSNIKVYGSPCFLGITFRSSFSKEPLCRLYSNRSGTVIVGEDISFKTRGTYNVITYIRPK